MKIFIYEFLTGGGFYSLGQPPQSAPSLLREGLAMAEALAVDFVALGQTEVHLLRDARVEVDVPGCQIHAVRDESDEREQFSAAAAAADWTIVIAPEFNHLLAERCGWVREAGGRLLGAGDATVRLAADKQATCEHLAADGLSVPNGIAVAAGSSLPAAFNYPAVLKPRDGAGSTDTFLIVTAAEAAAFGPVEFDSVAFDARLEEFCAGVPVSVSVLCGPGRREPLLPSRQHLDDGGRFAYQGGSFPLKGNLVERAQRLALAAIDTLPDPLGYIGVDMILSSEPADDVVLEVNPRLTTSYIGLRSLATTNLAGAILDIAAGEAVNVTFDSRELEFDADGTVRTTTGTTT